MFFVSEFLDYTATIGSTTLSNIGTLDPREEPQRNVTGEITVTFDTAPSGTIYAFADAIKSSTSIRDVSGSTDYDVSVDPYMKRSRLLFSFESTGATRNIDFNLGTPREVGTLLFFKKTDILRTSSKLFLTYPFQVKIQPRTLTITKVDGSVYERAIDDEPILRMTMNIIPASDYRDFSPSLEKLLEIVSPRTPFLYVGEENPWDSFLLKRTPNRQIDHNRQGTNRQSISALNLEVA